MAEECTVGSCVAISSSSTQLTQPNWWDLVSTANPWQQQLQLNPKYSNSSNNSDDQDQDVSISSTSFTNASNHSSLSVESSRRLVADQRSASFNDDLINGEQVSDNQIWNHVLLNVNGNNDFHNNDHDVGENFLDALSSKSLSSHAMYEPGDYLKKLNNTNWEFTNSAASNFNNFEEQISGGFIDNNNMKTIENERLTKLSSLVSTWSIAPPEPQLVLSPPQHVVMDHDHHYSQLNLCHLKPQTFVNDSMSCDAQMGITNRNSSLLSCYGGHNLKVDDQNNGHHSKVEAACVAGALHGIRPSFTDNYVTEYQIGLNNAMAADNSNSKYYCGNGISPDSYSSCGAGATAKFFADVISCTSLLGNNKPLIDIHAPKPNCSKSFNSSHHSKKQGLQTSSSTRMSSGRGQGTANEGKKKRTDDTSSETVLKKSKQESSTVSSVKVQAPKVKLGDRITALQQIVSPFGKTDTASVLYEAIQYIKFLQDQVHVLLNSPYLKNNSYKVHIYVYKLRKELKPGNISRYCFHDKGFSDNDPEYLNPSLVQ